MPSRNRVRPDTGSTMLRPSPESLMPAQATAAPASTVEAGQPRRPDPSGQAAAAVGTDPDVFLSGRVPRSLRDALRHQAIREGRPAAELLKEAVAAYLATHGE